MHSIIWVMPSVIWVTDQTVLQQEIDIVIVKQVFNYPPRSYSLSWAALCIALRVDGMESKISS